MRLFKVIHPRNGSTEYFERKVLAKRHRDYLSRKYNVAVFVNRGPDHWRGETF